MAEPIEHAAEQGAPMPAPVPSSPPTPDGKPHWLRRHQLVLAVPIALIVGLLIGGWVMGEPASGAAAADQAAHDHGQSPGAPTTWTCSMHPQIQLSEAGACPICGMDLIPLDRGGDEKLGPDEVVLTERGKALARIETAAVRRLDTAVEHRLLGRLEVDETKVRTVTPWVDGRIDRLFVSALGERVKRGQAIASIYSPEVYAAQADLLQARHQLERLNKSLPIAKDAAKAAYKSARTRLRLLGVSSGATKKMAKADSPRRNVAIISRFEGTVIEQLVHEGAYVQAGTPIYKLADLTTLWAQLDAYESDLPRIAKDQSVRLTVSSFPDETFQGTVAFIDPVVDSRTRTARIRVEVDNEEGRLSPGMFADAVIEAPEGQAPAPPLVIPDSAPLFTGTRSVVYVELSGRDEPTYAARQVQLGAKAADVYPVMAGLKEGELVVVRGAFALDSDLQIRAGGSMMTHDDDVAREARSPVRVSEAFMTSFGPVVDGYLDLQSKLSHDDFAAAKKAFAELAEQLEAFEPRAPEEARRTWKTLAKHLLAGARGGAHGTTLDELRRSFDSVSIKLIEGVQRFGNPLDAPVRLAFCPMAFDDRGALWLQRAEQIENPYFGAEMFQCGEIREAAAPEQRLGSHASHLARPKPAGGTAVGHDH